MKEFILNYPDYDLIVNGTICNNCILISKNQLPNGLLPNNSNIMYFEGNTYKVQSIKISQIIFFILAIVYIIIGTCFILYIYSNSFFTEKHYEGLLN